MKNNFLCKCLLTLGILLTFTVLLPCFPNNIVIAQASETSKAKSDDYRLNLDQIALPTGKSFTLKTYNASNAKIYFKSSDDGIASVNNDGVVSANKVGDAVITVTMKEGSNSTSLTCNVSVTPPAVSVKLTDTIVILGVDTNYSLNAIVKPANTAECAKYTTSNADIVTVSPGGRATGKSYGLAVLRAYIDATDSDGSQKYDACAVIVASNDNVSKLQSYFNDHTELEKISDDDLIQALSKFFTSDCDLSSTSLISNLNRFLDKELDLD